jgi:energy-coupling factor transporter ATP-binding protein EcfA2
MPEPFRGRAGELRTLVAACGAREGTRVALVGSGGSGKSTLAAALGHRLGRRVPGGREWFRVGRWDHRTLLDMLAIRLGVPLGGLRDRGRRLARLRRALGARGRTLVVLDNHEDDRATAALLNALAGLPVVWLITARRCLLSGVSVFPVVPPLVTAGRNPFPRVAELTSLLRWNPLALDVSNALVATGAVTVGALHEWLVRRGVARVSAIAHEDDLPEIRLLVRWAWPRVGATARRLLTVLAHLEGDHVDAESLASLARAGDGARPALRRLARWHLVQQPLPGRWALHATIRHAIEPRTRFDQGRAVAHYVGLLERHPERLDLEQTHLFAAMNHAHTTSNLGLALRLERLLERLDLA